MLWNFQLDPQLNMFSIRSNRLCTSLITGIMSFMRYFHIYFMTHNIIYWKYEYIQYQSIFSYFLNFQDKSRWFNSYLFKVNIDCIWIWFEDEWTDGWNIFCIRNHEMRWFNIENFDHLFNHSSNYRWIIIYSDSFINKITEFQNFII